MWLIVTGVFILLGLLIGLGLTLFNYYFAPKGDPLVAKIDSILPQIQCGQCGYPGCKPYAQALAKGDQINKCIPGGQETIEKLAELLAVPIPEEQLGEAPDEVAIIEEDYCIGCTKCIQACPVDAIIGARKKIHVIVPDICTGCELCIPPCPTDCIEMIVRPRPKVPTLYKNLSKENLIDINRINIEPL